MFVKKTMDELERKPAHEVRSSEKHPIILILDDIRSMHNVGSAFRTADAFAAAGIYLCGYTPQPPHRDIHKTALGATESVTWQHFPTTSEAVLQAKAEGRTVLAIEQTHNSNLLQELEWSGQPLALVFGNEVTGVNEEVLQLVDGVIEIPQWGSKHSLNISVSLGVVLWELVKKTIKKGAHE
jgi:23S rRNA (guanosine2251-2'-O)-methyltransferase